MNEASGPADSTDEFAHDPVMVDEVTRVMAVVPAGVVVDATVGAGGHSRALLEARPDIELIGIDQDSDALDAAHRNLRDHRDRVVLCRARFDSLAAVVADLGHDRVNGVLFDLGVSSPQLDRAGRGFSYRHDGPLDMRMDQSGKLTAAHVINTYAQTELVSLLRGHGDERHASRIARAIVAARPVESTGVLAEIVRDAIPAAARRRGGHPAKRTFQAIRIEVNDEYAVLEKALEQAIDLLNPGGRCAVLSYHSGEDRIVKRRFRDAAGEAPPPRPGLPPPPGTKALVRLMWRGTRVPGDEELARNRRAESARLRAVERVPEAA
jgi:16S rRNA (cytosine1402-N4)-methyltransferase